MLKNFKDKSFFLKTTLRISVLVVGAFVLAHCGQQSGSSTCGANVVGNGMTLAVTKISGSSYRMQLCANMTNPGVFSVYGANNSALLQQNSLTITSVRKQTITDAVAAGDSFQVDFLPTDNTFAIYYDQNLGGGNYQPSNLVGQILIHSIPQ